MKITYRKIADIKPYDNNPRLNEDGVEALARSIREFGFRQPLVVDGEGVIIVGHTRWKAAHKLGLAEVPVHVATGLTPEQVRAYRIADNQTASLSAWDYKLLPLELGDLRSADYDLGLLGFSADDLAKLLGEEPKDGLTDPDDPTPPSHSRVICGFWATIAFYAATHRSLPTWIFYWMARVSNWSTRTRRTT
jgi:ParB-like chromosome segregation protein Spo0J